MSYNKNFPNNKDINDNNYVYSDEKFDYCIVNGESLTRYYGNNPEDYESCPIHQIMSPQLLLKQNKWMKTLLKIDSLSGKPKYLQKKELLKNIKKSYENDLF